MYISIVGEKESSSVEVQLASANPMKLKSKLQEP